MEVSARNKPVETGDNKNIASPSSEGNFGNENPVRDNNAEKSDNGIDSVINRKMSKYIISDDMIELLYNQLQDEMINHNLYRSFALYYKDKGLNMLCEYFEKRAKEELNHHEWIYCYLKYCGINIQYPEIPATNVDVEDELTPFELTVKKEIETTRYINEMASLALKEGDYGTFAWLNGNGPVIGELIPEQTEEMSVSNQVLRIAKQNNDWLSKAEAILDFYDKRK